MVHRALLDTSFWSAAVHVGVDAYLPLFFQRPIIVPGAVVREVERAGTVVTSRLREDQQRFRLWLEDGRLAVQDPESRYPMFGPGEAACLALALEQPELTLLVNEVKCYTEAGRLGIRRMTVPEVVFRLVRDGRIGVPRGLTMLDVLEETTSTAIVERARKAIGREGRTS